MSDDEVALMRARIELEMGKRCNRCGRRFEKGWEVADIDPRREGREGLLETVCNRDECMPTEDVTFKAPIRVHWCDETGLAAPAIPELVRRLRGG